MNKNTQDPKLQMSTWTHLSAASMMYMLVRYKLLA